MKYTIKYLNYKLEINLFEDQKPLIYNSELAKDVKFLIERFDYTDRLFHDEKNIYIDVITVSGWLSPNSQENKGYFRDLVNGILDKGYNVIVTTPMGFRMNSILKKYGFRRYLTDSNNYYDEPVEVMYLTQEIKDLPRIYCGCVGVDNIDGEEMFVYAFYTEDGNCLGHTHCEEIGDNCDFAFNKVISVIDGLLDSNNKKNPEEIKQLFIEAFPKGYRLCFLIDSKEGNYFREWYLTNCEVKK